jgi:glycogen operon protein
MFFHLMLNAFWAPLEFELPQIERGKWRRWLDTSLDSPDDIVAWEAAPEVASERYRVADRSVVMLYTNMKMKMDRCK